MKNVCLFSLGFIVALASLFVSCGDKNNDTNVGGTGSGDDVLICKISVSNTDGGSVKITNHIGNSTKVLIGNSVEVVATPDKGYNFIGWFIGDSNEPVSTDAIFTFTASEDVSLLAKFEKSFAVSVRSSGNGNVSFENSSELSQYVQPGEEVTVVATPAENSYFVGWFIGDSEESVSTEVTYTFIFEENVTLVAKFIEAVDLGLSVMWASCNVGATSPEEYGGYYTWGETEEKYDYSWETYIWCSGSYDTMTKYCTNSSYGTVDNKTVLDPEDDVAHVKWGGDWRMPTKAEQDELRNNCTWEWTSLNGVNGYKVTGPNGNSIFLPAAGCRGGTDVNYRGYYGLYWSSSLYSISYSRYACYLYFDGSYYDWGDNSRFCGHSVRPVLK